MRINYHELARRTWKRTKEVTISWDNQKYIRAFFKFVIKDVIKPTVTLFLAFFVFVYLYGLFTGTNRTKFAPQQISSFIEKEVGTGNSRYQVKKIDFHGFGIESVVILLSAIDNFENGLLTDDTTRGTALYILDEVQPNPLQKFLFSEKLYEESFSLLPSSQPFDGSIVSGPHYFTSARIITDINGKESLFFCLVDACGIVRYYNGSYRIFPAVIGGDDYCSIDIKHSSNLGEVRLTKVPSEARLIFDREDTLFYIAAPVTQKSGDVWGEQGLYWERANFQICKYFTVEESYMLSSDHGSDFFYKTRDYYFKSSYQGAMYGQNISARDSSELEDEVKSNSSLIWWDSDSNRSSRKPCTSFSP